MALCPCDQKQLYAFLLTGLAYTLWEYWLGKTNRTRASSTAELVVMAVVAVATLVISLKGKKNDRISGSGGPGR